MVCGRAFLIPMALLLVSLPGLGTEPADPDPPPEIIVIATGSAAHGVDRQMMYRYILSLLEKPYFTQKAALDGKLVPPPSWPANKAAEWLRSHLVIEKNATRGKVTIRFPFGPRSLQVKVLRAVAATLHWYQDIQFRYGTRHEIQRAQSMTEVISTRLKHAMRDREMGAVGIGSTAKDVAEMTEELRLFGSKIVEGKKLLAKPLPVVIRSP